ncbi:30S ribosomal protein S11 [Candidatus Shikimatogenerans bostrichidophilus]|uniref:30S ribosomal protein S11 n=1 Tax=Candidatus Shikimatogenerans bostrichidophilus TaxID=2943807 RepID=UPI0029674C33
MNNELNKKKMKKKKIKNKLKKKKIYYGDGNIYIHSTFNNIIISLTDKKGNVLAWSSSGKMKLKGSKKNTPFAGQITAKNICEKCIQLGIKKVSIIIKGPGSGRESAIRTISNNGINIRSIKDRTPLPHNGCRPPKKRRI